MFVKTRVKSAMYTFNLGIVSTLFCISFSYFFVFDLSIAKKQETIMMLKEDGNVKIRKDSFHFVR